MRQSISRKAVQAAAIFVLVASVHAQTAIETGFKPVTTLSCYKDVSPLVEDKDYAFMTDGWCQQECGTQNKPVMAIVGGSTCYCGDLIPSLDKVVPGSNCNSPCNGFGQKMCGGIGYWQVYLTGLGANVKTAANGTDTADSSSSSNPSTAVVTKAGETVVVTQASSSGSSGSGPNKVGIAVGVIVAIVIMAAAVGAAIFFLKQRRKRAIEEEHRRNTAIAEFTSSKKSEASSVTDQRLDPSFLSSHRRESIGSIADEMDFTRRILQVNHSSAPTNARG